MAVPAISRVEGPLPAGVDRPRWGDRAAVDPAVRAAVAGLCDAVETEIVTLTRRLDAYRSSAQEAARALHEGLAGLVAQLSSAAPLGGGEPAAPRLAALANLAASLGADLDRCAELVQALPRRVLPLLRRSELTDRRRHRRTAIARAGTLLLGGRHGACVTLDLSEGGALVRPLEPWPELDDLTGLAELELDGVGRLPALLVGRSPLGLHLAFRSCTPAATASLGQLLREARRAERVLVGAARRIVDDLLSWRVDPSGGLSCGLMDTTGSGAADGGRDQTLAILDLHLAREPRLVAAWLFAADGHELAARVRAEGLPWEPPPEPPGRGSVRCRIVPPPSVGPVEPLWIKVEAEVGDAARTLGTLRLYACA